MFHGLLGMYVGASGIYNANLRTLYNNIICVAMVPFADLTVLTVSFG